MKEVRNTNSENSEKVLRERFSEAPSVDDYLWENIEKQLNKNDKRRKFILFRNVTFVLLLIGFSFSYLFYKLSNEKKLARIKQQENENLAKLNSSKNSDEKRNNKSKIEYNLTKKTEKKSIDHIELKTKIADSQIANTNNLSSTICAKNQHEKIAITNQNIDKKSNLDASTKQELTGSKTNIETKSFGNEEVKTELSVNESKLIKNVSNSNDNRVHSENEKVETNNKLTANNETTSNSTTTESSALNNNLIKLEIQKEETGENFKSNNDSISTTKTIEKDTTVEKIANISVNNDNQPKGIIARPFKRWEVGFGITPAYSFRNLATVNSITSPINSSERGTLKTNFGFNFGYNFNDHFKISGGVATLNYNSTFDVNGLVLYFDTDNNTLQFDTEFGAIIENQDDFEGEEPDETEVNENEDEYLTVNVKGSQTIQMIQFPILVTLKTNDKKINYFIEGGLTLNSILKSEFDIKIEGYQGITKTDPFNLNKITSSFVFNGGVEYKFSDSFSLQISPTFRYTINSISRLSTSKIHPYWLGTNIAFIYKF